MPTDQKRPRSFRQKAEKLLSEAPEKLPPASVTDLHKLVHELSVHQIELEMQNEELRRSREQLEESQSAYADFYDFAPVGYLTFDQGGIVTRANLTVCGLLGIERNLLLKKPFTLFVNPESQDLFFLHRQKVLATATTQSCQLIVKRKDGTVFEAQLESIVVQLNGKPAIRSVFTDITERKAEEALRRYELLFQNSRDVVLLVRHSDRRILEANAAAVSAYGYTRDELLNLSISDLRAKETGEMVADQLAQADAGGILFETIHRRKDGSTFPVEVSSQRATVAGTRTLISVIRDITQRRRAEEALRESHERFRVLANASFEGIALTEAGRILAVNDQLARMLGCEKDDLIAREVSSVIFPEDRLRVMENIEKERDSIIEHRFVKKDGAVITVEAHGKPFTYEGRSARMTALRDITERKKAEEALWRSEALLHAVMEDSSDPVYVKDRQSRILMCNPALERVVGKPAVEIIGRTDSEYYGDPVIGQALRENDLRVMNSGCSQIIEETAITPDGYRVFLSNKAPYRNESGEVIGIIGISHDITERKHLEDMLQLHSEILLNMAEGVLLSRLDDGAIVYANPRFERMFGYDPGELVGKHVSVVNAPGDKNPEAVAEAIARSLEHTGVWNGEVHNIRRDGVLLWCQAHVTTFDHPHYGRVGVTVSADITEHKRLSEELRRSRDELELRVNERTDELRQAYEELKEETKEREKAEAQLRQAQKMEALGTLAGGIAHDFNNMLAAIIGFSEIATERLPEDSGVQHQLQRILEAGLRGRDLVKQMLAFSRKSEQEKKPLLLSSILKESIKLLRASIPQTISIRTNVKSESSFILADPVQIQQVLMNLCTNAAHAMQERGGTLDVELCDYSVSPSTESPHGVGPGLYMKLTVSDTGIGIPPDIVDKIFDPFFTTKKQGEGTGLGLSVVHGIVRQSSGYITVESELNKGSAFTIYFPKVTGELKVDVVSNEALPTGCERILFVDDEEALVEMGEELLSELGYNVTCLMNSRQALALFRLDPSRFDLVISDQTMPEMTGVELAKEILGIRRDIPIIMCTGYSHRVDADTALVAGIKAFAMKPLTKREIAKTIRKVLDE